MGLRGAGRTRARPCCPPCSATCCSADSISWPLRLLDKIADEDEELAALEEVLARHEPGYERDPTKKIQLLNHLGHLKHAEGRRAGRPVPEGHGRGRALRRRRGAAAPEERGRGAASRCWSCSPPTRKRACASGCRSARGSPSSAGWCSGHRGGGREEAARRVPAGSRRPHQEASAKADAPDVRDRQDAVPRRDDIKSVLLIGSGPDRHRSGLRVRLFRHPGRQGAARKRATGSSSSTRTRPRS